MRTDPGGTSSTAPSGAAVVRSDRCEEPVRAAEVDATANDALRAPNVIVHKTRQDVAGTITIQTIPR